MKFEYGDFVEIKGPNIFDIPDKEYYLKYKFGMIVDKKAFLKFHKGKYDSKHFVSGDIFILSPQGNVFHRNVNRSVVVRHYNFCEQVKLLKELEWS